MDAPITALQAGGQQAACLDPLFTGSRNCSRHPCFRAGLVEELKLTARVEEEETQSNFPDNGPGFSRRASHLIKTAQLR